MEKTTYSSKLYNLMVGNPKVLESQKRSLLELPDELILQIFNELGFSDLKNASLACKRLYQVANDEGIDLPKVVKIFLKRIYEYNITHNQENKSVWGMVSDYFSNPFTPVKNSKEIVQKIIESLNLKGIDRELSFKRLNAV